MKTCDWCGYDKRNPCLNAHDSNRCARGLGDDMPEVSKLSGTEIQEKPCAISPEHYSRFKIEPMTFCVENNLNWFQSNIIKYVCRYDKKGGVEDLDKALNYLTKFRAHVAGNTDWMKAGA